MQYRLTAKHYMHDRILEPGTIVGTDEFPYDGPPSVEMEPVDEEAKTEAAKVKVVYDSKVGVKKRVA